MTHIPDASTRTSLPDLPEQTEQTEQPGQTEQPEHAAAFAAALVERLLASLHIRHEDNHQRYYQLGDPAAQQEDKNALEAEPVLPAHVLMARHGAAFAQQVATKSLLHSLLADEASRDLLVTLAAYAVLGHRRVKLPYHGPDNISLRTRLLEQTRCPHETDPGIADPVRAKWVTDEFSLFDLHRAGVPARVYTIGEEVFRRLTAPSYEWHGTPQSIAVRKGDIVLDCGAAFGDISLQFAHAAGETGRVVCLEPYPLFLRVFHENMRLNPLPAQRITLVERCVWHSADQTLSFIAGGGGSRIDQSSRASLKIVTTTIDRLVHEHALPRVDFIKMDIEGAELNALRGAEETLRRFRPRLAVCLYHSPEDFHAIPAYLHSLGLGYRLHLGHHYVNEWETVLYAAPA